MAALRPRSDHPVRAVISALQAQLPGTRGDDGGARPVDSPHHHHAVGAQLFAEIERRWNRFAQPAGASWRVDET